MHRFFFGPDKIPFCLQLNGMVESDCSLPFHGIVSRGLLNWLRGHNVSPTVWYEHAPSLEPAYLLDGSDYQDVALLRAAAAECKVLTFGQSAWCAQRFVELYEPEAARQADWCEFWNIKEGHTSSVWKVTYPAADKLEISFVINVARDQQAGEELRLTSERMQIIAASGASADMAQVHDIRTIALDGESGPHEVVVTKNEWIDNALEIHSRRSKQTGDEELILVERFITHPQHPAALTSIHGRILNSKETQIIRQGVADFLTHAGRCLPEKPEISINEGDVLWNGEKAIVIAFA